MKKILIILTLFMLTGFFTGCNSYEPPLLVVFDSEAIRRVEERFTEDDTLWLTPEFSLIRQDLITLQLMYTVRIDFPQDFTKPNEYLFTILDKYDMESLLNQNIMNFSSFFLRYQSRDIFSWTEDYEILVHDYSLSDIVRVYRLEARWGIDIHEYYFIIYDHRTLRILSSPVSRFIIQFDTSLVAHATETIHETIFARYSLPDLRSHKYSIIFPGDERIYSLRGALSLGLISIRELNQSGMLIWRRSFQRYVIYNISVLLIMISLLMVIVTFMLQGTRLAVKKIRYKFCM